MHPTPSLVDYYDVDIHNISRLGSIQSSAVSSVPSSIVFHPSFNNDEAMDDVSEYSCGDEDELSEYGCESFPFAFTTTREQQTRHLTNILKVEDEDVVCGRGSKANYHPGNVFFRRMVADWKERYRTLNRPEKTNMANAIVRLIRENNGRFLRFNPATNLWDDIGDAAARTKTSQALREGIPQKEEAPSDRIKVEGSVDSLPLLVDCYDENTDDASMTDSVSTSGASSVETSSLSCPSFNMVVAMHEDVCSECSCGCSSLALTIKEHAKLAQWSNTH